MSWREPEPLSPFDRVMSRRRRILLRDRVLAVVALIVVVAALALL